MSRRIRMHPPLPFHGQAFGSWPASPALALPSLAGAEALQAGSFEGMLAGQALFLSHKPPVHGSQSAAYFRDLYLNAFEIAASLGFSVLERSWNFIENINGFADGQGQTQYHRFNAGRCGAFGAQKTFKPAASTGIGTGPADSGYHFLFCKTPVLCFENDRQTSSWDYPEAYGSKPPMFARAVLNPATGAFWVSGTASIRDSRTLWPGDAARQSAVAAENIARLCELAGADPLGMHFALYAPDAQGAGHLANALRGALNPQARFVWLPSEICRPDLAVEAEGFTLSAAAPDGPGLAPG